MATTPADQHKVVVVGAGYAGLIATNRLLGSLSDAEQARVHVTVINPTDQFVERIRFHELAAGSRDTAFVPLKEILHPAAEIMVGRVDLIDPDKRTAHVVGADGSSADVEWNHLIYAVGSRASGIIEGSQENGFLIGNLEGAEGAAAAIRAAGPTAKVVVIGGGFTGVETASEIAERHPDASVVLMCAGPLVPTMRPAARRSLGKTLEKLGVEIRENQAVARVDVGKVVLADGEVEAADVCIVATSFEAPDLALVSGLAVTADNRLRVDARLRSIDHSEIIGAGDAISVAHQRGDHLRMGCAIALPLGGQAAETILSQLRGTNPEAISIGFLVQCISLGRKRGYIQAVHADDSPRNFHVGGRLAAKFKESVCKMSVGVPTKEQVKPGAYSWPKGPKPEIVA